MTDSKNLATHPWIADLLAFLDVATVNFLAVAEVKRRLLANGFLELDQTAHWDNLQPGDRRFVVKNNSAIFAFVVGKGGVSDGFKIISSHSDSPCFRIKPKAEMVSEGNVLRLNTEVYGGPILYTWFDRPLSMAGRVMLRSDDPLRPLTRIVDFRRPILIIPHLAIHFNRAVNDGNPLSKQKDMMPVVSILNDKLEANGWLLNLVAAELGVECSEIIDFDLSLYDTTGPMIVGAKSEFVTSGRLDDLAMVHASLTALLNDVEDQNGDKRSSDKTIVMAVFDNEETGSGTKQGAASPTLQQLLHRIVIARGGDAEDYMRSIDNSFLVSADNGHALHPNYPEKQDPTNHPVLGGGPVIKYNANCKYMTDADTASVFSEICRLANVPVQSFVNHSDVAGGSTLGNILTSQIDLRGVDMGAAIWAMHSVRETASVADHISIIKAFSKFYDL